MAIIDPPDTSSALFFAPALNLISNCEHARFCPELSDANWLTIGVNRCLTQQPRSSGRGFLQTFGLHKPDLCPKRSHFFESLKSARRLDFCAELNTRLCAEASKILPDDLAQFSALDKFAVFAADGHFHAHATHDPADKDGKKWATGHIYMRNLRCGLISHLTALDQVTRKKESEIRALKRTEIKALRQGTPKGRKVLLVYDRAIIDFRQWPSWKNSSGIYVLTRCKENFALLVCGQLKFDATDPINAGVLKDELVGAGSSSEAMRRITFREVLSGVTYEFITTVLDTSIAPGLLAMLYLKRWGIEKSFDEFKNKLGEKKAWASTSTAKSMQAAFISLTMNLLLLMEHQLATQENITNKPELERKAQRLEVDKSRAEEKDGVLPEAVFLLQRMTQRGVKLIRWVAVQVLVQEPWKLAYASLKTLYEHQ